MKKIKNLGKSWTIEKHWKIQKESDDLFVIYFKGRPVDVPKTLKKAKEIVNNLKDKPESEIKYFDY